MNYIEYLHIQSQLERMYDFHPAFFQELEETELAVLRKGFLYDTDDGSYPHSIKQYYEEIIQTDERLQNQMFAAAQKLYSASGSGDLQNNLKDIVSFPKQ